MVHCRCPPQGPTSFSPPQGEWKPSHPAPAEPEPSLARPPFPGYRPHLSLRGRKREHLWPLLRCAPLRRAVFPARGRASG
eukprot:4212349-Lingulodinium_polyedra.AAC.1